MKVRIDQTRSDSATRQVDLLSTWSSQGSHLLIGTGSHDLVPGEGDGLGNCAGWIDRHHLAVDQQAVGGRSGGKGWGEARRAGRGEV
jgi:hypothetical protein